MRAIIFDLDGVLVDTKEVHYETLNQALVEVGLEKIGRDEHLQKFDGLPTRAKLKILGLAEGMRDRVARRKQELTEEAIQKVKPDEHLRGVLIRLHEDGLELYCASNAVKRTVEGALCGLNVLGLFDGVYHSGSVHFTKPNPSIYLRCMSDNGLAPHECLIVEDSPHGRKAAEDSGARLLCVNSPAEVTYEKIRGALDLADGKKKNGKTDVGPLNILIPMAGAGSRFEHAGYSFPKPLIDVKGKPMVQAVVENLGLAGKFIFIVQKVHYEKYALGYLLPLIAPGCEVVRVNGLTEGAACTTLLAEPLINNDRPLLIANSDQLVDWDPAQFIYRLTADGADGGILTFENSHPKWSYAKHDEQGWVSEVAEKKPISTSASTGIYWVRRGADYVQYARRMIDKNRRVNGEFYVCPVFNEMIEDGKRVKAVRADRMWGLGTPEDLQNYLRENHEVEK